MEKALEGVRVLDLSEKVAGPYCARIFAGFGAEVIILEKPLEGDATRGIAPFLNDEPGLERSGLFFYLNVNKKGVTLNLETANGAKIFKELKRSIKIYPEDNTGTCFDSIEAVDLVSVVTQSGEVVQEISAKDNILFGHKISLQPIQKGDKVLKYGEVIGIATELIDTGKHVHVHNVVSAIVPGVK